MLPLSYPESNWLKFRCSPTESDVFIRCGTRGFYYNRQLKISIIHSQLHRWQESDSAVREPLDSFLINDSVNTALN